MTPFHTFIGLFPYIEIKYVAILDIKLHICNFSQHLFAKTQRSNPNKPENSKEMQEEKLNAGARLQRVLYALRMNQSDLANEVPIDKSTVSRWVKANEFSTAIIGRMLPFIEKHNVNRHYLMIGAEPMFIVSGDIKGGDLQVFPSLFDCDLWKQVHGDAMAPEYKPGDYVCLKKIETEDIVFGYAYYVVMHDLEIIRKIVKEDDGVYMVAEDDNYDRHLFEPNKLTNLFIVKGVLNRKIWSN